MLSVIMLTVIMLTVIMLTAIMLAIIMLAIVMLTVIMLTIIMLTVIMLTVVMLTIVMLTIFMLTVVILSVVMLSVAILSVIILSVMALKESHSFKWTRVGVRQLGAQKLTGENLKVVWAKFSTLSLAVFVMSIIAWYRQTRSYLKLKTQPRFCPVIISLYLLHLLKNDFVSA
jgi:hypothetical protein